MCSFFLIRFNNFPVPSDDHGTEDVPLLNSRKKCGRIEYYIYRHLKLKPCISIAHYSVGIVFKGTHTNFVYSTAWFSNLSIYFSYWAQVFQLHSLRRYSSKEYWYYFFLLSRLWSKRWRVDNFLHNLQFLWRTGDKRLHVVQYFTSLTPDTVERAAGVFELFRTY